MQIKLSDDYFNYLQDQWTTIYESRHCMTVPGMGDSYIIYMFHRPTQNDWRWVIALTEQRGIDDPWYTDGMEMGEIWEDWDSGVRPEPCTKSDNRATYLPQGISIYTDNPNPYADTKGGDPKDLDQDVMDAVEREQRNRMIIVFAVLGTIGLIAFLWFMSRKKR